MVIGSEVLIMGPFEIVELMISLYLVKAHAGD